MIRPEEIVAARDAARNFSSLVKELADGRREKAVIVMRNRPAAVMLSWDEYVRLGEANLE